MKVLVVDDRKENIEAAKIAFSDLNLNVVYASSAKEAMGIIEEKAFFDLVISDLEMEEKESGKDVVKRGWEYLTPSFIATGRKYESERTDNHGADTFIPKIGIVIGKKNNPMVWRNIYKKIVDHIDGKSFKEIRESLDNYRKFVEKPSAQIGELIGYFYSEEE